jgi:hypothetical protein
MAVSMIPDEHELKMSLLDIFWDIDGVNTEMTYGQEQGAKKLYALLSEMGMDPYEQGSWEAWRRWKA